MSEKTTPLYVVCSPRRCVGKTLVSRLLTEYYLADYRPVAAFDLADEGPQLTDYLPGTTTIVDISDIRGQLSFFDRLISDNLYAKVIDLGHRAFKNFFAIVREIRFFEEAYQHSIEPLILFIADSDPESAKTYTMLRHQFSEASSLLPVRNQIDANPIEYHDAFPGQNMTPVSLDIPFLGLSLRALVEQDSFSFSEFWRAPLSDLPVSVDDDLSAWLEFVFSQFRNLGLFFGWEDLSSSAAFNRSQPRHHQVTQAEQQARELHIASERTLALFGEVDLTVARQRMAEEKRAAIKEPFRDLVREKSRERARATKAAYKSSSAELSNAELAAQESGQKVVAAAIEVLITEAFRQANALEAAWNEVWRQYDRLSALADCELPHTAGSHPVKPAPEIVKLMETIAALDRRQFPAGRNHLAARAGELWCRWFEALLANAEAEAPFERDGPAIGTDSR
jgi:hypothetical protein